MIAAADVAAFERCVAGGGVAVFPADTVYGLACSPERPDALRRLYALKGRPSDKPSAVMWFDRERALAELPELGPRTRGVLERLLPGAVTLLLENPRLRFGPACGPDPRTLGIRVPALDAATAALEAMPLAVLQSSANASGGDDARRLEDVPESIRESADLVLDGGARHGIASTVIDLRQFERTGDWWVVREGAVSLEDLSGAVR